jgi:hypothetical protein
MFGWFRKRARTEAEIADDLMRQTIACTDALKVKWIDFNGTLAFKDTVSLNEIIELSADPASTFVEQNYPLLMSSTRSGTHFWMTIFTAVLESQTHPKDQVNAAIEELRKTYAT